MGLDMNAYRTSVKPTKEVDFGDEVYNENESLNSEIKYWRKHPNLHGWMESLYRSKGGADESFNCSVVQLTKEDLEQLSADIHSGSLPQSFGPFFGQSREDSDEQNADLEFVKDALNAIEEGDTVFYDSWW
jgi:hypothetical protein